ncbi:hypothetical protein PBY51_006985 [Eleginops maclovinus]|uniref:CLOCK-interacting pacemaker n=1 Tax=Eleginops maclovinus TaxID=56733 RepID=A0AAN7X100_ELEMC|nr:hypothetical protein PBY51_006985 [Eleginops maclovinus]
MSTKRKSESHSRMANRPRITKSGASGADSERDSGFSDASSEHMSTMDITDSEKSPIRVVQNGLQTSGSGAQSSQLAVVGGSYSSLSPMIIMNNVLLKQPGENPPPMKQWGFSPTVEVVQPVVQQPQRRLSLPPTEASASSSPARERLSSAVSQAEFSTSLSVTHTNDSVSRAAAQEESSSTECDHSDGDADAKRKRFCNTYNILSKSGLLDIALRTKELHRQNRRTQSDLDRLKEHTDLFLQALCSGDTSICLKLQASLPVEEGEKEKQRAAQTSLKAD